MIHEKCQNRVFFWFVFFRIWTEYTILQNNISISPNLGKNRSKKYLYLNLSHAVLLKIFFHTFINCFSFFHSGFLFFSLFSLSSFFKFLLFSMMDYLSQLKIDPMIFKLAWIQEKPEKNGRNPSRKGIKTNKDISKLSILWY